MAFRVGPPTEGGGQFEDCGARNLKIAALTDPFLPMDRPASSRARF